MLRYTTQETKAHFSGAFLSLTKSGVRTPHGACLCTMTMPRIKNALVLFSFAFTLIVCFFTIKDRPLMTDEIVHYPQVVQFINKDFSLRRDLVIVPGYHLAV